MRYPLDGSSLLPLAVYLRAAFPEGCHGWRHGANTARDPNHPARVRIGRPRPSPEECAAEILRCAETPGLPWLDLYGLDGEPRIWGPTASEEDPAVEIPDAVALRVRHLERFAELLDERDPSEEVRVLLDAVQQEVSPLGNAPDWWAVEGALRAICSKPEPSRLVVRVLGCLPSGR